MKGSRCFVVFLVLSASLLCTADAGRSRTSNQNSFRRAANGIYQTLSSVFGEENIRGLYKVSAGPGGANNNGSPRSGGSLRAAAQLGGREGRAPGPEQQLHGCHFEKKQPLCHN